MATVTPRSASREGVESLTVSEWVAGDDEASHSDRYLAARLAAATADYKGVALTTFLLGAGVGVLAWLGIGILAEHWVVAGGLPRWLRWGWLALGLGALVAAAVRWLVPLVRYRVNLVYAARQIEREHPELHNDLVNTVLVKARPDGSPSVVVTSLKRRTARRLADVAGSATMDRTTAVRLAYALMAAVGLACLYEVVAPKSLLVSAARLVAPWIGWAAPSRVRIDGPRLAWRMPDEAGAADARRRVTIDGGRAVVVRGRQLEVTAGIRGLRAGEQPVCRVTPLTDAGVVDPQATPWQVVMHSGPDADPAGRLFTALLPDAARGLDRSLDVSIVGGDAHTEPVRVTVVDAPSLLVREVRYDFPAYTRRKPETVAWQGDLRAVEETVATLSVEANQPLEAAWVDFGCDGQRDLKIKLSGTGGRQGTVSFPLRLNADRLAAEHPTYRLVFQGAGAAGERDGVVIDSLVHRIEVVADIAPEVAIEEPTDSPRRVPPGSPVLVRVRASDPDFGLARVGVETRIKGGGQVTPIVLLDEPREGVFKGSTRLVPDKLGAGAGSVLEYRGFAIDTRPQQTNVVHTPWQELQIDAAAKPQAQPADQPGIPDDPQRGDRRGDGARDGAEGARDAAGRRDRAPGDRAADDHGADDGGSRDGREPRERQQGGGEKGGDTGAGEENPRAGGRDRKPEAGRGQQRERDPSREPANQPDDQPRDQPGEGGGGGEGQQSGDRGAGEASGQQPNQGQNRQGGRGGQQGQPRDGASGGPSGQAGDQTGDDGMPAEGSADGGGGNRQRQSAAGGGSGRPSASERNGERSDSTDDQPAGESAAGEGDPRDDGRPAGDGRDRKGSGRGQGRVAADGTNDGEAMERILEDRRRNGGDDDAADGPRAGATDSGRQGEDRQGTDQRRADRSGQSPAGERTPRNDDSAPGGHDAPADGESGDATPRKGDPAATDGGKAGGASGERTRPEDDQGKQTGEAGQPTNARDGEGPGRGEQDRRSDGRAGNDPRNGDRQPPEGDRQPGDQRDARTPAGKETGSGVKGDDPRQTDGQSPDDGDGTPGRDPKQAGGREDTRQPGDDRADGQKGAGQQRAGEKGGQQGGGQSEGTADGAGEKGAGQKGGAEQGAGGEKSDQNRQRGDQGSGQEGAGQEGSGGQRGPADGDGEQGDGGKAGGGQRGPADGDGEQGDGGKAGGGQQRDDPNARGAGGSSENRGQPDGEQGGGQPAADQPTDAAAGGGKPNAGGTPAGAKPGKTAGRQSGKAGQSGGTDDPEGAPPTEDADPGPRQDGTTGKGGWARSDGAADPQQGPVDGQAPTAETEWGRQDVDHARNAADLAIEHLRRSLEKGDDAVLESLGWTKDDARMFLERWQTLRQQAEGGDPVKRREFERTLRSLGLRGGNVRSNRDVPSDVKGGQAEGRRSRPPSEYRERFKAYTQGTTSE